MLVALRLHVDVALGFLQGVEVLLTVLGGGVAVNQEADHEGGVEHLAEAELLDDVALHAEDVDAPDSTVDQHVEAVVRAADEAKLRVFRRDEGLQRLQGAEKWLPEW